MAIRRLREFEIASIVTYAGTVATSGTAQLIHATDPGGGTPFVGTANYLQVLSVSVQNISGTRTVANLQTSGSVLIWGESLAGATGYIYGFPIELARGEGLNLAIDGSNNHHYTVQYRVRQG